MRRDTDECKKKKIQPKEIKKAQEKRKENKNETIPIQLEYNVRLWV